MFERGIKSDEVILVIKEGEIIESYPDDHPYPSTLILGYIREKPIHVVVARNPVNLECIIVTVYRPDNIIWDSNFRTRRK